MFLELYCKLFYDPVAFADRWGWGYRNPVWERQKYESFYLKSCTFMNVFSVLQCLRRSKLHIRANRWWVRAFKDSKPRTYCQLYWVLSVSYRIMTCDNNLRWCLSRNWPNCGRVSIEKLKIIYLLSNYESSFILSEFYLPVTT